MPKPPTPRRYTELLTTWENTPPPDRAAAVAAHLHQWADHNGPPRKIQPHQFTQYTALRTLAVLFAAWKDPTNPHDYTHHALTTSVAYALKGLTPQHISKICRETAKLIDPQNTAAKTYNAYKTRLPHPARTRLTATWTGTLTPTTPTPAATTTPTPNPQQETHPNQENPQTPTSQTQHQPPPITPRPPESPDQPPNNSTHRHPQPPTPAEHPHQSTIPGL